MPQRQRFIDFIQQLSPGQFELLPFNKLRHHVVIVGVKPLRHFSRSSRLTAWRTSTTQAKQSVEIDRAVFVLMASRYVTQQQAGGQYVIVPGKIANRQQIYTGIFLLLPVTSAQLATHSQ